MSARDTALQVLISCRRNGAWSDAALKQQLSRDQLDRRDAALASRLVYGVLQNRMLLDHWIGLFVQRPQALQPMVLDILRLAVYQLRFFDRIPSSAAVNEAVEQAKRLANVKASGLVNAVLRNMLRHPERMSEPEDLPTRYSHPQALVELLRENVPASELEPLLAADNEAPAAYLQTNTLKTDSGTLLEILKKEGYAVEAHPWLPDCLTVRGGSPEQCEAFRDGLFYVQDPAANLSVRAAQLQPGMRVHDCCATPGGKSFAAAIAMGGVGSVLSCDIHPNKVELIRRGSERLGLSCISAECKDASDPEPAFLSERFDAVLADVPCSGLGVIRKKPDIRYKDLGALAELPRIQKKILDNQAGYVRPGGVLLFSTCTILRRENEDLVMAFLSDHPDYTAEAFTLPGGLSAPEGMLTLLPCEHNTDGFFIAKLRRMT